MQGPAFFLTLILTSWLLWSSSLPGKSCNRSWPCAVALLILVQKLDGGSCWQRIPALRAPRPKPAPLRGRQPTKTRATSWYVACRPWFRLPTHKKSGIHLDLFQARSGRALSAVSRQYSFALSSRGQASVYRKMQIAKTGYEAFTGLDSARLGGVAARCLALLN